MRPKPPPQTITQNHHSITSAPTTPQKGIHIKELYPHKHTINTRRTTRKTQDTQMTTHFATATRKSSSADAQHAQHTKAAPINTNIFLFSQALFPLSLSLSISLIPFSLSRRIANQHICPPNIFAYYIHKTSLTTKPKPLAFIQLQPTKNFRPDVRTNVFNSFAMCLSPIHAVCLSLSLYLCVISLLHLLPPPLYVFHSAMLRRNTHDHHNMKHLRPNLTTQHNDTNNNYNYKTATSISLWPRHLYNNQQQQNISSPFIFNPHPTPRKPELQMNFKRSVRRKFGTKMCML